MGQISKYFQMITVQIILYSILLAAISSYFIYTLTLYVKPDVSFSVFAFLFYIITSSYGFILVFSPNDRLRRYFLLGLIFQISITIMFIVVGAKTIKPDENYLIELGNKYTDAQDNKRLHDLPKINQDLECCHFGPFKWKDLPPYFHESCCKKLDKHKRCPKSLGFSIVCDDAYKKRIRYFKIFSLFFLSITIIAQLFLGYSYLRKGRF